MAGIGGDSAEISGVIRNSGASTDLIKTGNGTLALTGANTYTGTTTISGGTLNANNSSGSATGSGSAVVKSGGTLGGTGSIAGTVILSSGARIAPGSLGIESLALGGLTLETDSILEFELGTPSGTPGVNNDLLTVYGTTTINGLGAVSLFDVGGLAVGSYTLIDYAGILAGAEVASFLSQTPTGPAGFNYSLVDTGSAIDLNVSIAAPNDADFNNDGFINAADYILWRINSPAVGTGTPDGGDANGDFDLNDEDFDVWAQTYNSRGSGSGASFAVPEPASVVLVLLGVAAVAGRRRR